MAYEAARVRRDEHGIEIVDAPQRFDNVYEAHAYVAGTPLSKDGNRPWIRDTLEQDFRKAFVLNGGKIIAPVIAATVDDIPNAYLADGRIIVR